MSTQQHNNHVIPKSINIDGQEVEISDEMQDKIEKIMKDEEEAARQVLAMEDEFKDISFMNQVFLQLFANEPFLGAISMNITKIADHKQPTAYIGTRPNGTGQEIIMGFNPKFTKQLNENQQIGVIKHELYHMIFQHIFTRSMGERAYQVLWNWATDLAINSIIGKDNLPEMCLIPGHSPIDPKTGKPIDGPYAEYIKNAPEKQSSDFYFDGLRKIQEEQNDDDSTIAIMSGIGTMDDHNGWDELPADLQEKIKDKVRELMGSAAAHAQRTNSWGSVPMEIQEIIKKLLSREVDWRSILRNFVGRTRTLERNSTIRKVNKKLPYIQPGVRRPLRANFACFIDQSGSMSDDDISLMFSELESLSSFTSLDAFHFDTEVDEKSHTVWKKGSVVPKPHRTRCGGTDFNAVADFCNQRENRGKYAGIIILTDGYAPTMKNIIGSKVLWVITQEGTTEHMRKGDLYCQLKKEKKFKSY